MQDEYVKAIEKIQIDKDRKLEMRKILENEMASAATEVSAEHVGKRAKTTCLTKGAKAGIAAAIVAVTMGTLFIIPSSRNAINAGIRAFFNVEVPEGATDGVTKQSEDKKNRVIPTDNMPESEASAVASAVSSQDKAEEDYYKNVIVKAEYYKDPELNKLANYYAQKGYNLLDIKKDSEYDDFLGQFNTNDWYSEGFFVTFVFQVDKVQQRSAVVAEEKEPFGETFGNGVEQLVCAGIEDLCLAVGGEVEIVVRGGTSTVVAVGGIDGDDVAINAVELCCGGMCRQQQET